MEAINIEKLVDYKVLPFDIYNKDGEILFNAGEILTPGKLMQLRNFETVYRNAIKKNKENFDDTKDKPHQKEHYDAPKDTSAEKAEETEIKKETKEPSPRHKQIIENIEYVQQEEAISPIDELNVDDYVGPVNINSMIDSKTQLKLKAFYTLALEEIKTVPTEQTVKNYTDLRDKITNDLTSQIDTANFFSELKLLGEYSKCHELNVAILAKAFGQKYGMNSDDIQELTLAALLHDIGKKYLPENLLNKNTLTSTEKRQLKSHTKIGYEIIKSKLKFPERIARVALQHHELIDGSGYPNKISAENIDLFSQIVGLCSFFDNLTFNKTEHKVKNAHDALRFIIENCTKHYSSDVLYTFIYMFSYNDTKNFEDMVI